MNWDKKFIANLSKFKEYLEAITVVLIFLASFFLKLFYLKNGLAADYGAYLKWADALRGFDVVGKGLRYPPIYPFLLGFALLFLDEITALIVCAALVFSIIVLPYFLLARKIFGKGIFPIISSFLIVFNTLYSEMIAWGGNANMLALVFLAAFLIFWINCIRNVKDFKDKLAAAFFISLTVGSHYLAAAFLLIFFLSFLLLLLALWCKNRGDKNIVNIVKSTLIVGLIGSVLCAPYMFSYIYILNSAVLHETNLSLADQRTLRCLIFFPREDLFIAILLFLGVIGVLILVREDKLLGITLAALFISGCLPIFFTLHPSRWTFFWPIPLFLGVSVCVKKSLLKLKGFNQFKKLISLACLIALIFTSIFISIPKLSSQVSRYKVLTPQLLDALNYLKNRTPKDSIVATSGPYKRGGEGVGHCYGWWIEGYADRKCVATSYLRFLTYYDERETAQKANILFSGTNVLLNDFVMVTETFPAGVGNPEISINIGDFYDRLLFFADSQTTITYGQSVNITLSSIKDEVANQDDACSSVSVLYTIRDSTALVKGIRLWCNSTVEVSFQILQANITKIFVPLFKSDFVDFNSYFERNDKEIELEMTTSMGAYVRLNMTVDYKGTVNTYVRPAIEEEREFMMLVFDNPPNNAVMRLRFVLPKLLDVGSGQVWYYDAYKLIKEIGIDYIFININRKREFEWFNSDDDNFSDVYKNDEVAIFKVSPQH